jgi:hypothetical protein
MHDRNEPVWLTLPLLANRAPPNAHITSPSECVPSLDRPKAGQIPNQLRGRKVMLTHSAIASATSRATNTCPREATNAGSRMPRSTSVEMAFAAPCPETSYV